jgi:hypothetical protein
MIFRKPKYVRSGQPSWDGQCFAFDDPRIPESIRRRVLEMAGPGWELNFTDTQEGGEWWLFDDAGELAEGFWLED